MSGKGQQWFLLKLFCITMIGQTVWAIKQCCPGGGNVDPKSGNCINNNTKIILSCKNGFYMVNPNVSDHDDFSLQPNGNLFLDNSREIENDEFCVTQLVETTGSQTESQDGYKLVTVVILCFPEEDTLTEVISIILRIFMIISIVFLALTAYIYLALPNLRDLQGKCVVAFVCCLLASYTVLFVLQTFSSFSKELCVIQAGLLYLFLLASFFWNNIISFNLWRTIRGSFTSVKDRTWTILFVFWGFGVPLIMVLISFVVENLPEGNYIRPNYGANKCFFSGYTETWSYLYGPISVIIVMNILMFLHLSCLIYRQFNVIKFRTLKFKFFMCLKLFLLTGVTWVFEVISYVSNQHSNTEYIWYATDFLNSAQGILIFLVLVVFRQKVRIGLLRNKLFGINWPKSWANEELQESPTVSHLEEVELDNQKLKIISESL